MTTESSRLINWIKTDYSWREECAECEIGLKSSLLLASQAFINVGALAVDVAFIALADCKDRFIMTMGFAAGALAVNCVFLSLTCCLKQRHYCCNSEPVFTDKIDIVREKCCYDTTIGISLIYISINVACIVSNYFLCK